MHDRAMQALAKLALEPEWEALFEPNQYGFRPGRSGHDAVEAIFNAIRYKAKYVLDADIAKCFDQINHLSLLRKLDTYPTMHRLVRAWLKAGVIDNRVLSDTSEGTPQGGVISPLLANIALHGMEERIKQYAETLTLRSPAGRVLTKKQRRDTLSLIRYADDFVILHEDLTVVQRCQIIIHEWLADLGLELKPSKTRICNTLHKLGNQAPGFDFLGFNIRQYAVGNHHSGRNGIGQTLGFKTIITPSKEAVKVHYDKISEIIESCKAAPQIALIRRLNPIIRGWTNYHRTVCSKETFGKLDNLIFNKLRRWAFFRHPRKCKTWAAKKYWHTYDGDNWVFSTPSNSTKSSRLLKHAAIGIIRHEKVKGEATPFDGNAIYWSKRMGKHPTVPKSKSILLRQQEGKCAWCGAYFKQGDLLEIDHKQPLSAGGSRKRENLHLLHRHCHDEKTRTDQQWRDYQKLGEWLDANPW